MSNIIIRKEYLAYVPYIMQEEPGPGEDWDDFFHRLLHSKLKSQGRLRIHKPPRGPGLFELGKLPRTLDCVWKTRLDQYLEANGYDNKVSPEEVTLWDGLQLEDGFVVRPANCMRRITQDTSVVRYQMEYGENDMRSAFGQVQYFFSISIAAGAETQCLAYIEHYLVKSEGRLLYCMKTGKTEVVPISAIQELAAVITCQKKPYLATKESCLFSI